MELVLRKIKSTGENYHQQHHASESVEGPAERVEVTPVTFVTQSFHWREIVADEQKE